MSFDLAVLVETALTAVCFAAPAVESALNFICGATVPLLAVGFLVQVPLTLKPTVLQAWVHQSCAVELIGRLLLLLLYRNWLLLRCFILAHWPVL